MLRGMADAMIRLLDDPATADRLGRHAREHVRRHFAMDDSILRLSEILHEAAATRAVRAAAGSPGPRRTALADPDDGNLPFEGAEGA